MTSKIETQEKTSEEQNYSLLAKMFANGFYEGACRSESIKFIMENMESEMRDANPFSQYLEYPYYTKEKNED